jgi:hypothetical protein
MGFLSPWYLAGLLAAAIPVYFHLLRQHQSTPRPFSSLMFFERSTQSSIRHRRLRYLALLAARLALLVLLALTFASPYVLRPVAPTGEGRRLLLVVVDRSFSMRAGDRLERARQEALGVLARRNPTVPAQVAALDSQLALLTRPGADSGELAAAVRSIQASDARSSFGELVRALRAQVESSHTFLDVHFISDMQRSSMPPGFADLALGQGARLTLHRVAETEPNFTVENVIAPASIFDPSKVRVQATISGYNTPAARRSVSLVAAGKVLETKSVELPAGGRATVEFSSLAAPYGFTRCEVRLDAADSLAADDRFQFAVERADPRQLLFVHEARDTRSLLYFRAALESAQNSAFRIQPVAADQSGGVEPARYPVVVLSDVERLPENFEQKLKQHVRTGGAVFIAAGPAAARSRRLPLFDERVIESRYAARTAERFQAGVAVDPAHPSLRRAAGWEAVKFYQAVRVEPGAARVIARLSDETPLLMEKAAGEGRILLFASTLDNIANDFPLHPSFVPFIEQTVNYLGRIERRTSNLPVGAFVELRSSAEQGQAVEVIGPDGARALTLEEAAKAQTLPLVREGFYELRRANNRNEMVAVNADRREADLTTVAPETLALWENTAEGKAEPAPGANSVEKPFSLWWYVLLAVLAAALVESVLASRYLSVEREAA